MGNITIITLDSFTESDVEVIKETMKYEFYEMVACPVFNNEDLINVDINGNIEHREQRYYLKIKTNMSNIYKIDKKVYFGRLRCYIPSIDGVKIA